MIQAIQRPQSYQRASLRRTKPRIDAIRVFGYSSAIAANLIAAGLLLMPLQMPPIAAPEEETIWVVPPTIPPKPVLPPPIEQVRPPTDVPRVVAPTVPADIPPVEIPVIVEEGSLPALPTMEIEFRPTIEAPPVTSGPAPSQLQYAFAPPPPYPRERIRAGDEGVVMLQVLVDVDGRPLEVEVVESSGYRDMDRAAQRHVLAKWRFQPAMRDGRAVQAIGLVPIEFSID